MYIKINCDRHWVNCNASKKIYGRFFEKYSLFKCLIYWCVSKIHEIKLLRLNNFQFNVNEKYNKKKCHFMWSSIKIYWQEFLFWYEYRQHIIISLLLIVICVQYKENRFICVQDKLYTRKKILNQSYTVGIISLSLLHLFWYCLDLFWRDIRKKK